MAVSVSLVRSSSELQQVDDSRVVGANSASAIGEVVTADCSRSLEEGIAIG